MYYQIKKVNAYLIRKWKFIREVKETHMMEMFLMADHLAWALWLLTGHLSFQNSKSFAGLRELTNELQFGVLSLVLGLMYINAYRIESLAARRRTTAVSLIYFMLLTTALHLSGTRTVGIATRAAEVVASYWCYTILLKYEIRESLLKKIREELVNGSD